LWDNQLITADVAMKTIRIYVTNYTTLTGIHDGTRDIIPTNDGGGSSTDIIRRRASSPTQSKSPKFEHRGVVTTHSSFSSSRHTVVYIYVENNVRKQLR
jgi:hypothetical protein